MIEKLKDRIRLLKLSLEDAKRKVEEYNYGIKKLEDELDAAMRTEEKEKYSNFVGKYFCYAYDDKHKSYIYVKDLIHDEIWMLVASIIEEEYSSNNDLLSYLYCKDYSIWLASEYNDSSYINPNKLIEITKEEFENKLKVQIEL